MFFLGKSEKELEIERVEVSSYLSNCLIDMCLNDEVYFEDIKYDARILNKSITSRYMFSNLILHSNFNLFCNRVNCISSYYDSNGYFRLKLLGENIEVIFSGCNCGYRGEGSLASYDIIKYLFDLNNLDSSNLLFFIENNHLLNFNLKK